MRKKQETRDKGQEARDKRQEIRGKRQKMKTAQKRNTQRTAADKFLKIKSLWLSV